MSLRCKVWKRNRKKFIYERDRGICQLCSKPVSKKQLSLDHIIPVSKGGTGIRENLQLAHKICNSLKGNTLI